MDRQTNQPTDQPTNGRTDKASYRDAWTHLKKSNSNRKSWLFHSCKPDLTLGGWEAD